MLTDDVEIVPTTRDNAISDRDAAHLPLEIPHDCGHSRLVKTVSKHQAAATFESLGSLVHAGETVLVIHGGKPWLKMVPVKASVSGKTAAAFNARLDRISRKPIAGVSEVLQHTRR